MTGADADIETLRAAFVGVSGDSPDDLPVVSMDRSFDYGTLSTVLALTDRDALEASAVQPDYVVESPGAIGEVLDA